MFMFLLCGWLGLIVDGELRILLTKGMEAFVGHHNNNTPPDSNLNENQTFSITKDKTSLCMFVGWFAIPFPPCIQSQNNPGWFPLSQNLLSDNYHKRSPLPLLLPLYLVLGLQPSPRLNPNKEITWPTISSPLSCLNTIS